VHALLPRSACAAVLVVCLAACGSSGDDRGPSISHGDPHGRTVVAEAAGTGAESSRTLVGSSPVAVVAAADDTSQAVGASAAVGMRVPMLTAVPGADGEVAATRMVGYISGRLMWLWEQRGPAPEGAPGETALLPHLSLELHRV